MKCNPWRWLWGAIPIAMLAWVAVLAHRESIEKDLGAQVEAMLARSGVTWAKVAFIGRDGILTGRALDDVQHTKVMQAAHDTWGVRAIENRSGLIDKVDKYVWIATRDGNRIRLEGHVPSDAARRDITDLVRSAFPSARIEDKLVITRGAPPLDTWLAGIAFGLKQLVALKEGQVDMEQLALSLHGEAIDGRAYESATTALATGLPTGVTLRQNGVRAPLVKPWVSRLELAGDRVAITGYIPDDGARKSLRAALQKSLPKARIDDSAAFASGQPPQVAMVLDGIGSALGHLTGGVIEIKDATVSVVGVAESMGKADALRAAVKRLPGSYETSVEITTAAQTISPYVTQAALEGGAIVLTGWAPNEDARTALVAAARRAFGREIRDALEIGSGEAETWQRCLGLGFDTLRQLDKGRAVLIDRRLEVTGVADSERSMQQLSEALRDAAGGACATVTRITFPPPLPPTPAVEPSVAAASADEDRRRVEEELRQRAAAAAAAATEVEKRRDVATKCQDSLRTVARQGTILFEFAKADVDPGSHATLVKIADVIAHCPEFKVVIEGHTDSDGAPDRNQRLADRRARAVLDHLVGKGVPRSRLEAVGFGQSRNIVPNDTPENRAKNRRIEFNVVEK